MDCWDYMYVYTGADYGLGTIGTCLGPPPAGGPPSDQKKKNPYVSCEKKEEKMVIIPAL